MTSTGQKSTCLENHRSKPYSRQTSSSSKVITGPASLTTMVDATFISKVTQKKNRMRPLKIGSSLSRQMMNALQQSVWLHSSLIVDTGFAHYRTIQPLFKNHQTM